jgi:amino acid transporter
VQTTSSNVAAAPQTFTRKASGLVRSASFFDVFNFNVVNSIVGIGIIFMLAYIPSFYPGASLPWAVVITACLTAVQVAVYARMSTVFPRSGGDYVYTSRLIHPSIGFGFNLAIVVGIFFLIGQGGVYTGGYGIGPLLTVAGIYGRNPSLMDAGTWVSTSGWALFLIGAIALIGFICLFIFAGMKIYFRVQMGLMIAGAVGLLIAFIYGVALSRGTALHNIDQLLQGVGAEGVSKYAVGEAAPFSLKQTLMCVLWIELILGAALYSCFIGGEVKQPARTQQRGMLGALALITVEMFLGAVIFTHQFGYVFWANLGMANPGANGVSGVPSVIELSALSMNNRPVALLAMALFLVWGFALIGVNTAVTARCVFAWGLDKIVPKWLSRVSARFHSPYAALIVVMIGGVAWAAVFSAGLLTPLGSLWGFWLAYTGVFISAIILPFRMRPLWRASPCNGVVLGVPTIVIWGVGALIVQGYWDYVTFTDQVAGITPSQGIVKFGFFFFIAAAGIVTYFVSRAIRRTQGVDIDRNFQEVPPE